MTIKANNQPAQIVIIVAVKTGSGEVVGRLIIEPDGSAIYQAEGMNPKELKNVLIFALEGLDAAKDWAEMLGGSA